MLLLHQRKSNTELDMTRKPQRGFPAKYVLVKLLLLPEDRDYLERVQVTRKLKSRNDAGRLVIADARISRRFLDGIDANLATEPQP
jgi:hypothetical protein